PYEGKAIPGCGTGRVDKSPQNVSVVCRKWLPAKGQPGDVEGVVHDRYFFPVPVKRGLGRLVPVQVHPVLGTVDVLKNVVGDAGQAKHTVSVNWAVAVDVRPAILGDEESGRQRCGALLQQSCNRLPRAADIHNHGTLSKPGVQLRCVLGGRNVSDDPRAWEVLDLVVPTETFTDVLLEVNPEAAIAGGHKQNLCAVLLREHMKGNRCQHKYRKVVLDVKKL